MLPFECEWCHETFHKQQKYIKSYIKTGRNTTMFCSKLCMYKSQVKSFDEACGNCSKTITIQPHIKKESKSGKNFCSQSCAATYNNKHKTTGTRRSKLEAWLEEQLPTLYPKLNFLFNKKGAINSELDIHIPSLNLAFELNGIFHYEPIYGPEKLASIRNNDDRKFQACLEKGIELVIIDSSNQKKFSDKTSQKYLVIITSIIDEKLCRTEGN